MNLADETEDNGAIGIAEPKFEPKNGMRSALEVSIYENEIPGFVAAELDRLYETVYCTLARFRIYGEVDNASTYVARSQGAIVCVILFRIERGVLKVINQQIAIADEDLRIFADAVFAKYRSVHMISFYTLDTAIDRFSRPFQKFVALEENVLALPPTRDEYTLSLSQSFVKRLLRAERTLKRDHPGYHFEVLPGTQVSEQTLREIVGIASARMAAKQQGTYIREADIGKILQLIHVYGFMSVLTFDGVIRAGSVFYGVGARYFMHIIAHDPDYDKYMLGYLVQYWGTYFCIEQKGREFCLMGGWREYKERLRAFPKYLDSVDIYRSRFHYLLGMRRVSAGATRQFLHQARHGLRQLAQADSRSGRVAAKCLALARSFKELWYGAASEQK